MPVFGGLTSGTPWQRVLGHSSPSIAQPFSRRFPISVDAWSDCWRRRITSSVSTGGAKVGELRELDKSVGGVDGREPCDVEEKVEDEDSVPSLH